MQTKIIERYFFFSLLLLTLLFVIYIFKPFLSVILVGASFAVVLYPIFDKLQNKKIPKYLSAMLTTVFFAIVVCGPILGIGFMVFNQSQNVYQTVAVDGSIDKLLGTLNNSINLVMPAGIDFNLNEKISALVSFMSQNIAQIFKFTLGAIFSFILVLLSIFYFLKDGASFRKALIMLSPLSDIDDKKIITHLSKAINGVVKGYLLVALVQGVLMSLGLFFFGIPNPALWGTVAAIASLVPTVGTAMVSIPAVIFLLSIGDTSAAVGFGVWAMVVVGMVDNFLSPVLVGSKIDIPPLLILFSVLGGIVLFGPVGILIGPLSVSLLYTLISIYRTDFKV